jgi:hypothetical protein
MRFYQSSVPVFYFRLDLLKNCRVYNSDIPPEFIHFTTITMKNLFLGLAVFCLVACEKAKDDVLHVADCEDYSYSNPYETYPDNITQKIDVQAPLQLSSDDRYIERGTVYYYNNEQLFLEVTYTHDANKYILTKQYVSASTDNPTNTDNSGIWMGEDDEGCVVDVENYCTQWQKPLQ